MLVHVVKSMEPPEGVIPSFVWLHCVDAVYSLLPHSPHFCCFETGRPILIGAPSDGEFGSGSGHVPRGLHEPAGQVVKGASQVVQGVPGNQGNLHRERLQSIDVVDALRHVRLVLKSDAVWFGAEETVKGRLEILDVLFGPFDLPDHAEASPGHGREDSSNPIG